MTDQRDDTTPARPSPVFAIPDRLKAHFAAHLHLYQTEPEKAHLWDASVVGAAGPVTTLMLTTRGRKSGEPRPVTLQYFRKDGKVMLGATQGGMPTNPLWYENLSATPEVAVQIGGFHGKAIARTAEGEERALLWEHMTGVQTKYALYQQRTERQIPVVVLDFFESEGEMPGDDSSITAGVVSET